MKGFMGICRICKWGTKPTVSVECYNCIPTIDLAMHKPEEETERARFELNVDEVKKIKSPYAAAYVKKMLEERGIKCE